MCTLEKMDKFFENRLSGYDEHMRECIEGANEFYKFTASLLPLNENCKILDLGCGTGLELEEYFKINSAAYVTGIDLSAAMLGELSKKFPDKNLNLINSSYFDTDLETGVYNAAVSVESLHHFAEEQKLSLYKKLRNALTEDGYFILTDYFAESPFHEKEYFRILNKLKSEQNISDDEFYHYDTPLTVEHETEVLLKAGFSDVKILNNWGATFTLKAIR